MIPRELTWVAQDDVEVETAWYVDAGGGLDVDKLLAAFQQFFREHSEHWTQRFERYQEAGPQLLLQAYLQELPVLCAGRLRSLQCSVSQGSPPLDGDRLVSSIQVTGVWWNFPAGTAPALRNIEGGPIGIVESDDRQRDGRISPHGPRGLSRRALPGGRRGRGWWFAAFPEPRRRCGRANRKAASPQAARVACRGRNAPVSRKGKPIGRRQVDLHERLAHRQVGLEKIHS